MVHQITFECNAERWDTETTGGLKLKNLDLNIYKMTIWYIIDSRKTGINSSFLLNRQTASIVGLPVWPTYKHQDYRRRFRNEGVCCGCLMQCGAGDETILFLLHRNRFWLLGFSANCADLRRPSGISTEPLPHKQQKSKSNFLCLSGNNKPQTIQGERAIMCSCRAHTGRSARFCFLALPLFFHRFLISPFIIWFQNATTCQNTTIDTCTLFSFFRLDIDGWTDLKSTVEGAALRWHLSLVWPDLYPILKAKKFTDDYCNSSVCVSYYRKTCHQRNEWVI